MNEDDFHYEDGRYHCSNEDCDWSVPSGMDYMGEKHDCEEYADLTLEEFFKPDSHEWDEGADIEAMLEDVPEKDEVDALIDDVQEEKEG